ncbi:MAG: hypothetical protein EON59_08890, partial [Alphaproteobacteria bacterium]
MPLKDEASNLWAKWEASVVQAITSDIESLSLVLDLIRTGEAKARPELQRVTGLGRGMISERVNQLLRSAIVVEGDLGLSTGGRAARELQIDAGIGVILVAYSNLTHFHVGLADLTGKLLATRSQRSDFSAGPDQMFSIAENLWAEMVSELGLEAVPFWGIGVGIPAHSNFDAGTLIDSPSLPTSWNGHPIRETLSAKFNVPVWLE